MAATSNNFAAWYVRGEGNQPAGPFTADELIQSWRAGRLDPNTICWREGMAQWIPLRQVEPFASVIPPATLPHQGPAAAPRPSAPPAGEPAPAPVAGQPAWQRSAPPPWLGWAIACGLAAICVLVAGAVTMWNNRHTEKPAGATGSNDSASQNWGSAVRVTLIGENRQVETTFLVGLKDAWWTDYGSTGIRLLPAGEKEEKRTFFIVYYYKNLGPREGSFSLGPAGPFSDKKVEIKTDKGHIFSGHDFSAGQMPVLFGMGPQKRDVGGWQPKQTTKIEETGESALVFQIPRDEVPIELITSGAIDLDAKLPQFQFGFRRYTDLFGFLPANCDKVLPGLIEALSDKDGHVRTAAMEVLGTFGGAAKDAVPTIANVLLHDEYTDIRTVAAKTLGEIGPAAKDALFALRDPLRASQPMYGGAYTNALIAAAREAIARIDPNATSMPAPLSGASPQPKKADNTIAFGAPLEKKTDGNGTSGDGPKSPDVEIVAPRIAQGPEKPPAKSSDDDDPQPKGALSGTWQDSAGAQFRIDDDGKTATVEFIRGRGTPVETLSGKLSRRDGDPDSKSFAGTLEAVFRTEASKRHLVHVTGTIDDSGRLHIRCSDWPFFNNRGKFIGTNSKSETWSRLPPRF